MRGKRAKTYKKLMEKFSITFGFREPYQVLVDSDIVHDTHRFSMELEPALERTLRGEVKPMITQCSMRHLYARKNEPGIDRVIEFAKTLERRFCGHHPSDYPEPLSTLECFSSVVDPKNKGENKHRYVVASQEQGVRKYMRHVPGVPLIYVHRSVMIMEPMTDITEAFRAREERAKFRAELKNQKGALGKRKRANEIDDGGDADANIIERPDGEGEQEAERKKRKKYGKKEPNPLAVRKPKNRSEGQKRHDKESKPPKEETEEQPEEPPKKKIRKRKGKKKRDGDGPKNDRPQATAGSEAEDSP
ncbi:hypothetical protein MKZ38_000387 [Zalerion maritima]|uniref:U three protein 23 n=1 Tax=Zalerion maritima TaxID=339359 RepID=A0AAD5RSW9_9PEZI|nr:hypothetical protein MKZ38_000387 [Zalerion maritima]